MKNPRRFPISRHRLHLSASLVFMALSVALNSSSAIELFGSPCRCRLDKDSFAELLEKALAAPGSHESSHALAQFVTRWHRQSPEVEAGYVNAVKPGERYLVKFNSPDGVPALGWFEEISPAFEFKMGRAFAFKTEKLERHRRDGIGAPLVAFRENRNRENMDVFDPQAGIFRPVTAVIRAGQREGAVQPLLIDLYSPLRSDRIDIDGQSYPLAADLSAPWAALLERSSNLKRTQLVDFVDKTPKVDPRIFLLEPYNPNKEPLIMVHGLLGSPLIWAELTNTLWADDEIRARYQVWHFLYNTSAPPLYSGRILRTQLRELRPMLDPTGKDPAMQSTTVIAHSMGAVVARSLLTKPGSELWEAAFTRSLDSLELSESDRAALREGFFWDSMPHVKRMIYIAPSHLGSDFADSAVGMIGRLAAIPPRNGFQDLYTRVSKDNPGAFTAAYAKLGQGKLDSLQTLSPKLPTLRIHASLPNNHAVREFSIIGNRGKPGPIEQSSDGIVPYWSSHIDRAESEKIVPADHFAFENEIAIEEVKRILKLP